MFVRRPCRLNCLGLQEKIKNFKFRYYCTEQTSKVTQLEQNKKKISSPHNSCLLTHDGLTISKVCVSFRTQHCQSREVDRSWYGTSMAASNLSTAEPGIAVESTAMISHRDIAHNDSDSGYCCCRGMHQPTASTSRRCIPVTVNYRRMMIDAQTDKNDSRSKQTRFVSSVSTDIELSPIVQREKRIDRLLAIDIRSSTSNGVDTSPVGTLCGTDPHVRRPAVNQRPSVLRLTTFRPRTPSNGTASTSELDDGVFEGEERSAHSSADNRRPEVDELNGERHHYQQSNDEQVQLIDKRLQPDLLPLVMGVMVTNGRPTSRVVAQLGGQSVDELL